MSTSVNKSLILNEIKSSLNLKSDAEFARYLGIKPQTLSTWHTRNTFDIELIYSKCEQINAEYLLTGKGNIFKTTVLNNNKKEATQLQNEELNKKTIEDYNTSGISRSDFLLKTDRIFQNNQIIPLYDISASAGLITLFKADKQTPIDYYSIPNLPKVDGAVQVTGDSMYPLLKSGDIVFFRQINNFIENLFWGEMYLLDIVNDDDEYTTVKYIQTSEKGSEWIKLVSYNIHHSPKDIHLSTVKAAAFVKGSLRMNSMR
ncbi:LexA family transcriptional regulator [Sphingobacterium bovistauri]|uniref:LexA family transcriptional regulator n=1 Tax=Sphingobacterium bovistauri TaxID=2781959 RepID=A0ABS7Z8K7_9SPHI|nr:S24 family peptidase [Sphingobacterium bovistauri]MCA5006533.1 LexA family transcriptional regulator [Sphingobacterium bovistauri]